MLNTVILVVHVVLALSIIGMVLLQKSEGGGLGLGGGGASASLFTPRGSANFLTRTTAFLAAGFMATSLTLAILGGIQSEARSRIEGALDGSAPTSTVDPASTLDDAGLGGGTDTSTDAAGTDATDADATGTDGGAPADAAASDDERPSVPLSVD